jgi:hypothetical protein
MGSVKDKRGGIFLLMFLAHFFGHAFARPKKPGYPLQSFLPLRGKKGFPLLSFARAQRLSKAVKTGPRVNHEKEIHHKVKKEVKNGSENKKLFDFLT